jgi:threonine synthase
METFEKYSKGFLSDSISDELTLEIIKTIYEDENYLLDPHGAVAVAASDILKDKLGTKKLICLATAHPAKFPDVIRQALGNNRTLPKAAFHNSIEVAKKRCEKVYLCDHSHLEEALVSAMEINWNLTKGTMA